MDRQVDFISGIYASRAQAERVRDELVASGYPAEKTRIFPRIRTGDHSHQLAEADDLLKDVLLESAVGATAGTAVGALGELALVAANVILFATSPVVAPLAMLGWGAAVGGLLGGAMGANGLRIKGTLADLVLYGIRHGHVTLAVEAGTPEEARLACDIIGDSAIEHNDRRSMDIRPAPGAPRPTV